jgi:hypothetical protein
VQETPQTDGITLKFAYRPRGGRFGRAHVLALNYAGLGQQDFALAAGGDGRAVVAWSSSRGIKAALLHGAHVVHSPTVISPRGELGGWVTAGIAASGVPIVAWEAGRTNPDVNWVHVANGDAQGHFHLAGRFQNRYYFSDTPTLVVARDGTAVLVWLVGYQLHAAARLPGEASFGPQRTISSPREDAGPVFRTVITDNDQAIVAWGAHRRGTYGPDELLAATYKPA